MPPAPATSQFVGPAAGSGTPHPTRQQGRGCRLAVPGSDGTHPAGLPPVAGRAAGGAETDPTSTHTHSSSDPVGGTVSGRSATPLLAWSAWPCTYPDVTQLPAAPTRPSADAVTRGFHPTHLTPTHTVPTPSSPLSPCSTLT